MIRTVCAIALVLGTALAARAETYGSAQQAPDLVAAHLELALAKLRTAETDLTLPRGSATVLALRFDATRQALYEAGEELGNARMATTDPGEDQAIADLLAGLDDVRWLLDERALAAGARLREVERDVRRLEATVRGHWEAREEAARTTR